MEKDWVVVFYDGFLPKVEMARALLLQHDVTAIVLNQQDSVYQTFGDINLLVKKEDFLKAATLIKDFSQ
jgi:hypothetical protein